VLLLSKLPGYALLLFSLGFLEQPVVVDTYTNLIWMTTTLIPILQQNKQWHIKTLSIRIKRAQWLEQSVSVLSDVASCAASAATINLLRPPLIALMLQLIS